MSTVFGDGTPIALLVESVKCDDKPLSWILPALIAALSRQQTQTPMEEPEDTFVIKWFRRQGPHV